MTALFFACLVAGIFAAVVVLESESAAMRQLHFGRGLIHWLASGNWPAKLGGGLLVIGAGALLRYALLRVDVAPELKLSGGIALSAALFICAHLVRSRLGRREISVALAGAAFGVAYLTAYSAYAFFHYLQSGGGLVALAFVAIGAGTYAILRNTISVALLAMFGAFLAPAFALEQPSALEVFGYYIAISQLTLVMVAIRGWRPLIHLSFLFTLAGGLFFAWTAGFYTHEHFAVMQPLVLILVAIHIAMPLVEQRSPLSRWRVRFDVAYFAALPIVSSVLLAVIAPSTSALANSLFILGGIWLFAALAIRIVRLQGGVQHAAVGLLLIAFAAYVHAPNWPWLLIGEAIAVAALLATTRYELPRSFRDIAAAGVLMFGVAFTAASLTSQVNGLPFANEVVLERLLSGLLLVAGWRVTRRIQHPITQLIGWMSAGVLANTMVLELYRCHIASWPIIAHAALIAATLGCAALAKRRAISNFASSLFALALVATSMSAVDGSGITMLAIMVIATPVALLTLALRSADHAVDSNNGDRVLALSLVPLVTGLWASPAGTLLLQSSAHFAVVMAAFAAIGSVLIASRNTHNESWVASVHKVFGIAFGIVLLRSTLFQIEHGILPIIRDALCLAVLLQITYLAKKEESRGGLLYAITALGSVLVAQAMLLRALGPDRTMTVLDVFDLQWPAVISLFWSVLGATLTIMARKSGSRALWSAGASVLVACAAKLILLDFGSLGELTNILAVIAAGLVFLLVSWLSPLPPKDAQNDPTSAT